jgi:hypothetical protein
VRRGACLPPCRRATAETATPTTLRHRPGDIDENAGQSLSVPDNSISKSLLGFIRSCITSVWALELLLLMKRRAEEVWSTDQLVRELRSSNLLVADILLTVHGAGLLQKVGDGYRYEPATEELRRAMDELERLTAERPVAVRNAILAAPHDRIQVFADAFRIKKE